MLVISLKFGGSRAFMLGPTRIRLTWIWYAWIGSNGVHVTMNFECIQATYIGWAVFELSLVLDQVSDLTLWGL